MAQAVVVQADKGLSLVVMAQILGVSTRMVQSLRDRFHRFAQGGDVRGKQGGRHHQNMTLQSGREFLTKWREKVNAGRIVVACEMREALVQELGREVAESTFYRMVRRHT
jgi:transposase